MQHREKSCGGQFFAAAGQYCHAKDYRQTAKKAVLAMQAQVGDLVVDHDGIAVSGLLVRHLVMPGLAG